MPPTAPPRLEIRPGVWLDARRALWLATTQTLVVADIHWGYAATHRARGNLLPIWGDDEIAQRLDALSAEYAPQTVVWLGDSLHGLAGRTAAERYLAATATRERTAVLAGNHDQRWDRARTEPLAIGEFRLHHGDREIATEPGTVQVIGHYHPAFAWHDGAGTRAKYPALVDGPKRLILPAFSPWAAGTPWNDRRQPGETLWAMGSRRILRIADPGK